MHFKELIFNNYLIKLYLWDNKIFTHTHTHFPRSHRKIIDTISSRVWVCLWNSQQNSFLLYPAPINKKGPLLKWKNHWSCWFFFIPKTQLKRKQQHHHHSSFWSIYDEKITQTKSSIASPSGAPNKKIECIERAFPIKKCRRSIMMP